MIRRCPQCGTATDDMYGFCIKCGHEFPKIESDADRCPLQLRSEERRVGKV